MNWLIWLWIMIMPTVLSLLAIWSVIRKWLLRQKIQKLETELDAARRELAALEALTAEDRAWLDRQWQNPAHE